MEHCGDNYKKPVNSDYDTFNLVTGKKNPPKAICSKERLKFLKSVAYGLVKDIRIVTKPGDVIEWQERNYDCLVNWKIKHYNRKGTGSMEQQKEVSVSSDALPKAGKSRTMGRGKLLEMYNQGNLDMNSSLEMVSPAKQEDSPRSLGRGKMLELILNREEHESQSPRPLSARRSQMEVVEDQFENSKSEDHSRRSGSDKGKSKLKHSVSSVDSDKALRSGSEETVQREHGQFSPKTGFEQKSAKRDYNSGSDVEETDKSSSSSYSYLKESFGRGKLKTLQEVSLKMISSVENSHSGGFENKEMVNSSYDSSAEVGFSGEELKKSQGLFRITSTPVGSDQNGDSGSEEILDRSNIPRRSSSGTLSCGRGKLLGSQSSLSVASVRSGCGREPEIDDLQLRSAGVSPFGSDLLGNVMERGKSRISQDSKTPPSGSRRDSTDEKTKTQCHNNRDRLETDDHPIINSEFRSKETVQKIEDRNSFSSQDSSDIGFGRGKLFRQEGSSKVDSSAKSDNSRESGNKEIGFARFEKDRLSFDNSESDLGHPNSVHQKCTLAESDIEGHESIGQGSSTKGLVAQKVKEIINVVEITKSLGRGAILGDCLKESRRRSFGSQDERDGLGLTALTSKTDDESEPRRLSGGRGRGILLESSLKPKPVITSGRNSEESNTPSDSERLPKDLENYEPPSMSSSESLESLHVNKEVAQLIANEPSFSDQEAHEPVDQGQIIQSKRKGSKENVTSSSTVYSSDCTLGEMLERIKNSGALLHGDINIRPLTSIYDVKLHPHVHECLDKKTVTDMTRCQIYSVPVLMQWRSLVLIGPPNSGKSLAYVVPLLSLLMSANNYSELKPGNGPRCVFVVSCAQSVRHIAKLCSAVCAARLVIITTHGGGLELERKDELTNGCDLLITTPRCWLRLRKYTFVTNINRLCHIVFDEADILFKLFKPEVKEIMALIDNLVVKRKAMGCNMGVQTVIVGETWTSTVANMTLKRIHSPVLCITAFLEAALYARVKPVAFILQPEMKVDKLCELLEENKNMSGIIVCNNAEEVKQLRPVISVRRNNVFVAHEEMVSAMLTDVHSSWLSLTKRDDCPPLLLCSDDVLGEMPITTAQWLLHYNLPLSKSNFNARFGVIKDNFYDRIKNPEACVPNCKVHLFIDETNEEQFPEVVTFMSRLSTPIPPKVKAAVENIKLQKEMKKDNVPFCLNMLQFGSCWKEHKCKSQHIFNLHRDTPKDIPQSGCVKVKILHIHSPAHYSARLLAHSLEDAGHAYQWTSLPTNYALIGLKMSSHYSNRDNRYPHGRPKVGDLVGIEYEKDSLFYRARVTEITSRDEKCKPTAVKVLFIDEGFTEIVQADNLLSLPSELQEYPCEAVDIFLSKLLPVDLDTSWSYAATSILKKVINKLILSTDSSTYFWVGKIGLSVGRNIIVNQLLCFEHLELTGCDIPHISVGQYILRSGLAVPNPDHLTPLYKLCQLAGIQTPFEIPPVLAKVDEKIQLDDETPQWGHLDKDDFVLINLATVESPSLFFIRIANFYQKLLALQKELDAVLGNCKRDLELHQVCVGKICCARTPDNDGWNRAQITEVLDGNRVIIFYVDHGDSLEVNISDLVDIPKGFISSLPFQALECELIGIKPLDDEWLPEAGDAVCELGQFSTNEWKNLQAKVCDLNLRAEVTGGRRYKVVLVDTNGDTDIVINKELMYRGFANWDPATKYFLAEVSAVARLSSGIDTTLNDTDGDEEEWSSGEENGSGVLTREDRKMIEGVNLLSLTQKTDVSSGVASTIEEALYMLEHGDFDFNYNTTEVENIFPTAANFLKKKLPELEGSRSSLSEGTVSSSVKSESNSRGQLKALKVTESENDADVSDLEERKTEEVHKWMGEAPTLVPVGIHTPLVYWRQDDLTVMLKINLSNVESYHLRWTSDYVYFSSEVDNKLYRIEIDLFGPINPDTLEHHARGLYVEIKMEKLMKGHEWPRVLHNKIKSPWIKPDPDFVRKDDEESSLIESFYNLGVRGASKSVMENTPDLMIPGVPDQLSDGDSEASDVVEFNDIPYDPFDPLS